MDNDLQKVIEEITNKKEGVPAILQKPKEVKTISQMAVDMLFRT